jgi:hypothetical protein
LWNKFFIVFFIDVRDCHSMDIDFPSVFQPATLKVYYVRPGLGVLRPLLRVALRPDLGCSMDIQKSCKKRNPSPEYCMLSSFVVWNVYINLFDR